MCFKSDLWMENILMKNTILSASIISIMLGLAGCGGSDNKSKNSGAIPVNPPVIIDPPDNPSPPITPEPPSVDEPDEYEQPVLIDPSFTGTTPAKETPVVEEQDSAKRDLINFANMVTAETLNRGLLDRLMYAMDEMSNDSSDCFNASELITPSDPEKGRKIKSDSSCLVNYDVANNYTVKSGSFEFGESGDHKTIDFKDMVLNVGGKDFVFNGVYKVLESGTETHSFDRFQIFQKKNGQTYVFENFELKYDESSSQVTTSAKGGLKVFDPSGNRVFRLSFQTDPSWKRTEQNAPSVGSIEIKDLDFVNHWVIVKASSSTQALVNSKVGSYLPHVNSLIGWNDILIEPSLYYIYK